MTTIAPKPEVKNYDPIAQARAIERAVGGLVDKKPFYSPMIARTRIITETDDPNLRAGIRWAGDRIELYLNPNFFCSWTVREGIGVLEHEYAHFYLRHLNGSRNMKLMILVRSFFEGLSDRQLRKILNIAMDLEINETIVPKSELPADVALPSERKLEIGLLAEEYLRLLKDQITIINVGDLPEGWEDVLEGDFLDEVGDVIIKDILKECKARGDAPAGLQRLMDKLTPPQIVWPQQFSARVLTSIHGNQHVPSWARCNRRGLSAPGRIFKEKPDCWVFQDTSGSMSQKELTLCASEIVGLAKYFNQIHVVVVDAAVHDHYLFQGTLNEFKGGGGSDFCPAFDLALKEARMVEPYIILLTDGMINVPAIQPVKNIFWVLTQPSSVPYGEAINIR